MEGYMIKYAAWILFWSGVCGLYAAHRIDEQAGWFAFTLCLALSLLPLLGCIGDKQDNRNRYNQRK